MSYKPLLYRSGLMVDGPITGPGRRGNDSLHGRDDVLHDSLNSSADSSRRGSRRSLHRTESRNDSGVTREEMKQLHLENNENKELIVELKKKHGVERKNVLDFCRSVKGFLLLDNVLSSGEEILDNDHIETAEGFNQLLTDLKNELEEKIVVKEKRESDSIIEDIFSDEDGDNGFACGVAPDNVEFGQHQFSLSAYHEVETLFDFSMKKRNIKGYEGDAKKIQSTYNTMGKWWDSLNVSVPTKIVQVCYGGVFAASVSNIMMRDISIWKQIEKTLSRGTNIQEGHYTERAWAALLATPLQPFQMDALLYKADGVCLNKNSMHGALMARPQMFLHIGVFGTYSTELLTEYLVNYNLLLKLDGYNIAVHGKHDDGTHGFPNVDRLASCMWSDMIKSMFPAHQKDAIFCPDETLPQLTDYMTSTQRSSQDLVMLNPWLVRPGTAESLGIFIDPLWENR